MGACFPAGRLIKECDFEWREEKVPELESGQALVRNVYLSLDPANRGWVYEQDTYMPFVRLGEGKSCVARDRSRGGIARPDPPAGRCPPRTARVAELRRDAGRGFDKAAEDPGDAGDRVLRSVRPHRIHCLLRARFRWRAPSRSSVPAASLRGRWALRGELQEGCYV